MKAIEAGCTWLDGVSVYRSAISLKLIPAADDTKSPTFAECEIHNWSPIGLCDPVLNFIFFASANTETLQCMMPDSVEPATLEVHHPITVGSKVRWKNDGASTYPSRDYIVSSIS